MNEKKADVPMFPDPAPDTPRAAGLAIEAYRRMLETAIGKVRLREGHETADRNAAAKAAEGTLRYALGTLNAAIELGNLEARVESRPILAPLPPRNANEPEPAGPLTIQGRRFA